MILRWPGLPGRRVDKGLCYQTDLAATVVELAGGRTPDGWDGRSFAEAYRAGREDGREYIVASQNAWACMRAVRWGDHMMIRTCDPGLKNYPERMLFNVADDPHELRDLAATRTDFADRGQTILDRWTADMMATNDSAEDPMRTVRREGGPFHTRGHLERYCARLRATGRAHHADTLLGRKPERRRCL